MRNSGILMPITSLPGKYGIGTLGKNAYEFVDFLVLAGQRYWQILPFGPTGYGDSPYQTFSSFAGNPYYIDLETLIEEGLLTKKECKECDFGDREDKIDYEKIYLARFDLLKKAYKRSSHKKSKEYKAFVKANKSWLEDYALYMTIKATFGGKNFLEWDEKARKRDKATLKEYSKEYKKEINFYKFMQFMFDKQWKALKKYANDNGVLIIGDIPIYTALDSADTWASPELFSLTEEGFPKVVAGCPPDAFSRTGQLWGNPVYNWDYHKRTGYKWWKKRIKKCYEYCDCVRIDHFRGFDEYYAIPYGDSTAENGKWMPGPGMSLFRALKGVLKDKEMIAEDLGVLTDSVLELVKNSGCPGMKILQFAFDPENDSFYLPHNYDRHCVVYTGTHDNTTSVDYYNTLTDKQREMVNTYMCINDADDFGFKFATLAMQSVADKCIIPIQDYLNLGAFARINTPSTLGNNWVWRMDEKALTKELANRIYNLTKFTGRLYKEGEEVKEADNVKQTEVADNKEAVFCQETGAIDEADKGGNRKKILDWAIARFRKL